MASRIRALLGKCLITILVINSFAGFSPFLVRVHAQKKVIVVNAEQPNLWTLEQAHYLLAQMHRRNLDLKAKKLADLDPNEIAGLRFDVMRMLVEFGATFNQADLAANSLLSDNQTFNSERRQELLTERDRLRAESLRLTGDIEDLEIEKADTNDENAKKRLDTKIAAKNTRLARVDKETEQINSELATLAAPSGQLKATEGGATFDANKLPKSSFDKAFEEAAAKQIERFSQAPKINASLQLDNFVQMQYEIISKQLSLLRDELGPGERLVFLELPQTVNVAHHESDKKWAQSWWKIAGYTIRQPIPEATPKLSTAPTPLVAENQKPITIGDDLNSIFKGQAIPVQVVPCNSGSPTTFTTTKPVNIDGSPTKAKPNPSSIIVTSPPGRVTKVTVTLNGLRHPSPDDVDMLLVGPQGQKAVIMSDVGDTVAADDLIINLDDAAASPLPDNLALSSGVFKPTDTDEGPANLDKFLPPTLLPAGGSSLSVFNGTNPNGEWKLYTINDKEGVTGSIVGGWSLHITTDCTPSWLTLGYRDDFINLDDRLPATSALNTYLTESDSNPSPPTLENRQVRTVELIPRQSSLNVSDMKLRTRAGAFNFVLSTLFGFGSRLNVQRQREQFSQFVQQELYSSAFGKGAREFGWTFTPMPGTDRLQSGVRTTYAVVVVPEEATSLVLESNGCYFPRSYYQPNDFKDTKSERWNDTDHRTSRNCGGTRSKAFVVPIPSANINGSNDFWVDRIAFREVPKGKRVVVSIGGKNFSPQMGVLINGVPLVQSIGLAQPLIRDDSDAGRATADELKDAEVSGRIERVDSNKVVFSFRMPPDFTGTPTITLIAPGRATDINWIPHLSINGIPDTSLKDYPNKMFGQEPPPDEFRIDRVRVFRKRMSADTLTAQVSGAGFIKTISTPPATSSDTVAQVLVNGSSVNVHPTYGSPNLLTIEFPTPADDTIKVTLVSTGSDPEKVKTIESEAITNPAFLSVADVEVITFEAATEDEPTSTLVVKITGSGFTDKLTASLGGKALDIAVKSATEAILTISDPKAASIVTLEDDVTKQKVKVVVTRKTRKPEK